MTVITAGWFRKELTVVPAIWTYFFATDLQPQTVDVTSPLGITEYEIIEVNYPSISKRTELPPQITINSRNGNEADTLVRNRYNKTDKFNEHFRDKILSSPNRIGTFWILTKYVNNNFNVSSFLLRTADDDPMINSSKEKAKPSPSHHLATTL